MPPSKSAAQRPGRRWDEKLVSRQEVGSWFGKAARKLGKASTTQLLAKCTYRAEASAAAPLRILKRSVLHLHLTF